MSNICGGSARTRRRRGREGGREGEEEEEGKEEQDISKVFIARTSSSVSSKYRQNGSTERIKSRVLLSGFLCISLGTK